MDEHAWLAERFEEHGSRLRAVAYRTVGSLAEADEAVQEGWVRVSRLGAGQIDNLSGQNPACLSPNVSSASTFSRRPVKNLCAPPPQTDYLVRSNRPCIGACPSALGRRLRFGYFSSETRGGRHFGFLGNFRELRHREVRGE